MIITDVIFFMVLFIAIVSFFLYAMWSLNAKLRELKSKLLKNHIILKTMNENVTAIGSQLSIQHELIEELRKNEFKNYSSFPQDNVIQSYARAKSLVQRGLNLDKNSLKSCNLTDEEIELLSESLVD